MTSCELEPCASYCWYLFLEGTVVLSYHIQHHPPYRAYAREFSTKYRSFPAPIRCVRQLSFPPLLLQSHQLELKGSQVPTSF